MRKTTSRQKQEKIVKKLEKQNVVVKKSNKILLEGRRIEKNTKIIENRVSREAQKKVLEEKNDKRKIVKNKRRL